MLAEDWGYKASIGSYDFDERRLNGWVDEFIMYDYALNEDQTFHLLGKMRCPTGKSTTTEIDAFKFETMNLSGGTMKRSIKEDDTASSSANKTELKSSLSTQKDSFTSKINTKYKRGLNETTTTARKLYNSSKSRRDATTQTLVERMLIAIDERLQSKRRNKITKKPHR